MVSDEDVCPPTPSERRRLTTQLGWSLRELKRASRSMAVASTEQNASGTFTDRAERLSALLVDVAFLCVFLDVMNMTTWEKIARLKMLTLAECEHYYAPMYQRWLAGETWPWRPPFVRTPGAAFPVDLAEAEEAIEEWLRQ